MFLQRTHLQVNSVLHTGISVSQRARSPRSLEEWPYRDDREWIQPHTYKRSLIVQLQSWRKLQLLSHSQSSTFLLVFIRLTFYLHIRWHICGSDICLSLLPIGSSGGPAGFAFPPCTHQVPTGNLLCASQMIRIPGMGPSTIMYAPWPSSHATRLPSIVVHPHY